MTFFGLKSDSFGLLFVSNGNNLNLYPILGFEIIIYFCIKTHNFPSSHGLLLEGGYLNYKNLIIITPSL